MPKKQYWCVLDRIKKKNLKHPETKRVIYFEYPIQAFNYVERKRLWPSRYIVRPCRKR